jgi:hypothetical protein
MIVLIENHMFSSRVLADVYRFGNRQAFNVGAEITNMQSMHKWLSSSSSKSVHNSYLSFPKHVYHLISSAFQSLGLDCANWTEPIYADLVRCVFNSLALSIMSITICSK